MAPAIYEMQEVKRAICAQLFGGCQKVFFSLCVCDYSFTCSRFFVSSFCTFVLFPVSQQLPDGMRLRGDINILLLGFVFFRSLPFLRHPSHFSFLILRSYSPQ
jgi:hypothetical protein